MLSALARLFTAYLQHAGFTLGVEDILVLPPAEEKRRELLDEGRECGDESAIEAMNLKNCDRLIVWFYFYFIHFLHNVLG